jgi:hypothetical protein
LFQRKKKGENKKERKKERREDQPEGMGDENLILGRREQKAETRKE